VNELSQRVVENQSSVSKDEIDELERLSSLVAIHEATRSRAALRAAAIVLALSLFVGGLLLMLSPVSDTNVVLTMSVSELGFRLASPAPLTETVGLNLLEATGISGIKLENYKGQAEAFLPSDQIRIVPGPSSRLGVPSLHAESKARVSVAYVPPQPLKFRIQVEDTSTEAAANLLGSALLETAGQKLRLEYPAAQQIPIVRSDKVLDLTMVLPDTSKDFLFLPLRISELEAFRIVDKGGPVPDTLSTLRTARLTFTDLNGPTRDIHPSEVVKLKILRDGKLRQLSLRPDRMVADFTGKVQSIVIGDRSVMPTRFEWAAAQNAAAVLWSAASTILVTFFAAWRWLRRPT
jgi:hypothetical protein